MASGDDSSSERDVTKDTTEVLDMVSVLRGTATLTFLVEVVTAIMMLGSGVAFVISRSGLVNTVDPEIGIFLLGIGGFITLLFILASISFFLRVNRRISRAFIWSNAASIDLRRRGAKTVVTIYGLAIGIILLLGVYGYYIIWKNYFAVPAQTSLSVFGIGISLGGFIVAFFVQVVVVVFSRTAGGMIKRVLVED